MKKSTDGLFQNPIEKLSRMKGEAVEDFTHELLTNPRFATALGGALDRIMKTKRRMNRNLGLILGLSGIPNKSDYDLLVERAHNLNKVVTRLEKRLDELLLRVETITKNPGS